MVTQPRDPGGSFFMVFLMPGASNAVHRKGCNKQEQRYFWVWSAATAFIWYLSSIYLSVCLSEFYSWGIRHWAWAIKVLKTHPSWNPLWWNTWIISMQQLLPKERDLLENILTKIVNWPKCVVEGLPRSDLSWSPLMATACFDVCCIHG